MKTIKYWIEDFWPLVVIFALFFLFVRGAYKSALAPRIVRTEVIEGTKEVLIHCIEGARLVQVSSSDAGTIYRCVP